ncbi:Ger(x)C family spore germination C-terminal domain-containing protein [Caloramator quimbayensis]|uniref:Ger(x)C family spore germination C-terminal domain-containing protein n=1 Tax=Caloramator quimbayensis TaxID=1147123 RepID=UPI00099AC9BE
MRRDKFLIIIAEDYKSNIESEISQRLKEDIKNIILKSQSEFNTDFFNFYKYFRAQHPYIFKTLDWNEEYKNAEINLNVETRIERLGIIDMNAKKKFQEAFYEYKK